MSPIVMLVLLKTKDMKAVNGKSELGIGRVCVVRYQERSKKIEYMGKLLALGSNEEMELEMT